MWRIPSNLSLKDAAVLICGHSTAVFAFTNLCKPKEGDNIVISAGPAGLGLAAVDVAANVYKAKVKVILPYISVSKHQCCIVGYRSR